MPLSRTGIEATFRAARYRERLSHPKLSELRHINVPLNELLKRIQ